MKIAVIRTGGKQYLVKEKDHLKIEKLTAQAGEKVFLETLLVADGGKAEIGEPVLSSQTEATVIRQARSRKVIGIKFKNKTRQHKKFGHRQYFSELEVSKI